MEEYYFHDFPEPLLNQLISILDYELKEIVILKKISNTADKIKSMGEEVFISLTSCHPNIVQTFDVYYYNNNLWVIKKNFPYKTIFFKKIILDGIRIYRRRLFDRFIGSQYSNG